MKQFIINFLFGMTIALCIIACGGDDEDDRTDTPKAPVTVHDDGTTSDGEKIVSIDDKNFYLDYIKYTVEEGHLTVSGYDKTGFKGAANVVATISYKGNNYEVLSIGNHAFNDCNQLISITLPNTITIIGNSAFRGCSALTSFTIPNNVTSIGNYAFEDCINLTSINIPNSITSIGYAAFTDCTLNAVHIEKLETWCKINFIDNPLSYAHHLFLNGMEIKELVIPNTVTSISDKAFINCNSLVAVTIPNSVKSIGKQAFMGCSNLTTVTILNNQISIEQDAFDGCSSLVNITPPNIEPFNTILAKAPYKDQAVAIDITSTKTTNSQYNRLKKLYMTESGAYLMAFEEATNSRTITRTNSSLEYLFGKYTYANSVYTFDSGLKISLTADGNNYAIRITLTDGRIIELTGTKATFNFVPTGTTTDNLCSRPWSITSLRIRIKGKDGAVGTCDFKDPVDLAEVKAWAESNNKHIKDDIKVNTIVKGIIFAANGLFAIIYENHKSDVGTWNWSNMSAGVLGYRWNDPFMGLSVLTGKATVSFSNNPATCTLTLMGKVDDDDMEFVYTLN